MDLASDSAVQLPASSDMRMVNWDLHYGNVLSGTRMPWLVVDPKVMVGSPEFGVAQLLWTRLEDMGQRSELEYHLRVIIDVAGLDALLTRSWILVRVVDYWLWGLSIGLTDDPARCEMIIDWMGF